MDNNISIRKSFAGLKRPGIILCFSLIAGILAEVYLNVGNDFWYSLGVASLALYALFYFKKQKLIALIFIIIMIASFGGIRTKSADSYDKFDNVFQGHYKKEIVLRGTVAMADTVLKTPVDELGRIIKKEDSWYRISRFVLECESVKLSGKWVNLKGKVRIKVHGKPKILYRNMRVEVRCKLYPLMSALNPGAADFWKIFRRKGIYALGGLNDSNKIKILQRQEQQLTPSFSPFSI